jgi:hypothetical protein
MRIEANLEEDRYREKNRRGIWGNAECVQCGACCQEYNLWLYKTGQIETPQCENFAISMGKAYCLAHDADRQPICKTYFCGNTDPIIRFREQGDLKLRKIAEKIGTIPDF